MLRLGDHLEISAAGADRDTASMRDSTDIIVDSQTADIDWLQAKAALAEDQFDNGRSANALRRSFENSDHVAFAWLEGELVGMARMLSDGVCNAYLLDVWTKSSQRRRGVATAMVRSLIAAVPGQHIGLQTDDATAFYVALGFEEEPKFLSTVAGRWLDNDANR